MSHQPSTENSPTLERHDQGRGFDAHESAVLAGQRLGDPPHAFTERGNDPVKMVGQI